jgi:hypothetical protein
MEPQVQKDMTNEELIRELLDRVKQATLTKSQWEMISKVDFDDIFASDAVRSVAAQAEFVEDEGWSRVEVISMVGVSTLLLARPQASVFHLKLELAKINGTPPYQQSLTLEGCEEHLRNSLSLTEASVVDGCKVYLVAGAELDLKSFKFTVRVKFNDFANNYPMVVLSENRAFQLHGLGPAYGANRGRVSFYLQTANNTGPHGRGVPGAGPGAGEGWVSTPKLTLGKWHMITVEKGLRFVSIALDDGEPAVSEGGGDFEMKPTGLVSLGSSTSTEDQHRLHGEVKDLQICW